MAKKLVFIGFAGSGKSTLGREVAKKNDVSFIDTDEEIERYLGYTIEEIFQKEGEQYFRKIESEIYCLLENANECIISTGGGAVLNEDAVQKLFKDAFVIYLKAKKETIIDRLKKDKNKRPLLSNQDWEAKVEQLLNEREGLYTKYASKIIEVDNLTIDEIVKKI